MVTFESSVLHGRHETMRQSMRSSTSTTTTSSAGARERSVRVVLLNREEEIVTVESKAKLQEVFNTVCERLSLRETEYFGLARLVDDEYNFLELDTKLSKLLPKQSKGWRTQSRQEERPLLTLYFRVQYYVEHVILLKERVTRQLYYQQLKDNLLHHSQLVSEDRCFLLAAYSIQADHGNYIPNKHGGTVYFDAREYFPAWVVNKRGKDYISENMPGMHADLCNMPKTEAAKLYVKELSQPPLCHNTHMYKLKKSKEGPLGSAWLGICPRGIEIYEDLNGFKSLLSTFLWPNIGKLHFEKKKFEIFPTGRKDGRKFRYYTGSDERSKYLLWLCQGSHIFQLQMAPKLAEQRHMEAEDRKYKESYIHSYNTEPSVESTDGYFVALPGRTFTPRRSVASTASSNTTSGIASERLHTSIDESEVDTQSQEIMINSPPQPCTSIQRKSGHATPNSLKGRSPIPFSPQPQAVSRTSSGQSKKSDRLVPKEIQIIQSMQTPNPKPADAMIKRTTFAPAMTVTSNPVVQNLSPNNMLPIVSGMATSNVHHEHDMISSCVAVTQYGYNPQHVLQSVSPRGGVNTQQIVTSQHVAQPIIQEHSSQTLSHNPQYIQPLAKPRVSTVPQPPLRAPATEYPLLSNNTSSIPDHTYVNMFPVTISQPVYTEATSNLQNNVPTTVPQQIHFQHLHATSQPPFYISNQSHASSPFQSFQPIPSGVQLNAYDNGHQHVLVSHSHHCLSSGSEYSGYNSDLSPYTDYSQMSEMNSYNIAPPLQFTMQPSPPELVPVCVHNVNNMVRSASSEMLVTRPNRSHSQSTPPNKPQYPPQRAASNAETLKSKRATVPSCPMHGLRSDLLKEIEAKKGPGKFPLLTALCSDISLQNKCTCGVEDSTKRFSYSPAHSGGEIGNGPRTVTRPLSWHSENFNLDRSLQIYNGPVTTQASVSQTPSHQQLIPKGYPWVSNNGMIHQSMDSLDIGRDYPTMVTHQNGQIPSQLNTGISGAKSLDNLLQMPHYCNLGLAS